MRHCLRILLSLFTIIAALGVSVAGQGLISELTCFDRFLDTSWIGRFFTTPAPPGDHVIEWEAILDGHVVHWSKRVDALGFAMETFFYWDRAQEVIAFTQLTNRGIHGAGIVIIENSVVGLEGYTLQAGGKIGFKQTFQITVDGTLEDRYYTLGDTGWVPQHVIVYEPCLD